MPAGKVPVSIAKFHHHRQSASPENLTTDHSHIRTFPSRKKRPVQTTIQCQSFPRHSLKIRLDPVIPRYVPASEPPCPAPTYFSEQSYVPPRKNNPDILPNFCRAKYTHKIHRKKVLRHKANSPTHQKHDRHEKSGKTGRIAGDHINRIFRITVQAISAIVRIMPTHIGDQETGSPEFQ